MGPESDGGSPKIQPESASQSSRMWATAGDIDTLRHGGADFWGPEAVQRARAGAPRDLKIRLRSVVGTDACPNPRCVRP